MLRRTAVYLLATACAASLACSALIDINDLRPGDANDSDAAAIEAGATGDGAMDDGALTEAGEASCPADASFTSDPKNCGTCGHDCLGGECKDSRCQPFALADSTPRHPHWLAIDSTSIYWADRSTVHVCSKTLCAAGDDKLVVALRNDIAEIAVGGGQVFWSECSLTDAGDNFAGGGVFHCPTTGCAGDPDSIWGSACAVALAHDDASDTIVFSAMFSGGSTDLYRCPPTSSCSASLLAQGEYYTSGIAIPGGSPFWLRPADGLYRCAAANCIPPGSQHLAVSTRFAMTPPSIVGSEAGSEAYWATYDKFGQNAHFSPDDMPLIASGSAGAVWRAPVDQDGGSAEKLSVGGSPTAVVADEKFIRFADHVAGAIFQCPRDGCDGGATTLALGQGKPFALVQDDKAIYWANWGDGRIMKLAK